MTYKDPGGLALASDDARQVSAQVPARSAEAPKRPVSPLRDPSGDEWSDALTSRESRRIPQTQWARISFGTGCAIENTAEITALSYVKHSNENPGAAATATGEEHKKKASQAQPQNTKIRRPNAMSILAEPAHKAAARMAGYALTLRSDYGCRAAAFVFRRRLNTEDRAILATAILGSLTDDELAGVLLCFCGEESA